MLLRSAFSSIKGKGPHSPTLFILCSSFGALPPPSLRSSSSSPIPMAMPPPKSLKAPPKSEPIGGPDMAKRLFEKYLPEVTFSMFTPFALSLASGILKIDSFRHYIAQDFYFLQAFDRAYVLAAKCADDDDAKAEISRLRKSVSNELKMHKSHVQEWELDLDQQSINPATSNYTQFLLDTASGKEDKTKGLGKLATPFEKTVIAAYTLGAMTPCMRLYAFLGKKFQELLDNRDPHPYKIWIDGYSSKDFEAAALQTEDLLQKLSAPLTSEELKVIEKLYHQALKLETDFFSSQPLFQPTVVPLTKGHNPDRDRLMIFTDFDLTCTTFDSSSILADVAIFEAKRSEQNQSMDQTVQMSSDDIKNKFNELSAKYAEELEQCVENIVMSAEKLENFDFQKLSVALEQLSEFEKKANDRFIEWGLLKGLSLEDIKRAGLRMVSFQDGCINFFKRIVESENLNANVHVLSYCWCDELIKSAFSSAGVNELDVHANDFAFEGSVSTGDIVRKMESPFDKVQAFRNILSKSNDDKKNLTVYIGDSLGDLLCLLEADIGIVIGQSNSLRKVGTHFGVSFVPLFDGLVAKQKEYIDENSSIWKGLSGVLYTVSSWHEVHAFILGCQSR